MALITPGIGIVMLEDDDRHTDAILLEGVGAAGGYGVSLRRPDRIEAGRRLFHKHGTLPSESHAGHGDGSHYGHDAVSFWCRPGHGRYASVPW